MKKIDPMSDIGRQLAAKEGEFTLKGFRTVLNVESSKIDAAVRKGLDKEAFVKAQEHKMALASAELILQSIFLYHQAK